MNSDRFGLSVRQSKKGGPSVNIYLQSLFRHQSGMIFVAPECSSMVELRAQVTMLKEGLDGILREGEKAFAAAMRAAERSTTAVS